MLVYKHLNTRLGDVLKRDWHPDFDFKQYFIRNHTYEQMQTMFEQSFLDKLNQFSQIKNMMIFCRSGSGGIHTDPVEKMGLNFIKPIGYLYRKEGIMRKRADAGVMQWYTKKPTAVATSDVTVANTPVDHYSMDQVEFLTEAKTDDRLILVKTDLPHCAKAAPRTYRICFSFRFFEENLTTENSIDRLIQLGL